MQIIFLMFIIFVYLFIVCFVLVWDLWVFLIFIKNNLTWITRKQRNKTKNSNVSPITIFCLHAINLNVAKSNVNLSCISTFYSIINVSISIERITVKCKPKITFWNKLCYHEWPVQFYFFNLRNIRVVSQLLMTIWFATGFFLYI